MDIESKKWFYISITTLIITDLVILLDIPFLRQIFGFLFLTIFQGLLILQLLKLNRIDFLEKFILSWGISIAFLMFFGLLLNNLSLSLGYERPLSTTSLLISFNLVAFALIFIAYRLNKCPICSLPNLNLNTSEKAFLIVPILFPALSILGMYVMNTTDNNIILMFLLFLIPIYIIFICFFNHKFPKRLYPVVIFLISISLVLMLAMRSNRLIGVDAHVEYYYFWTTLNNLHWSAFGQTTLDACLVISLLPTVYQSILNTNTEYLFRILYSVIFSISPLVIYVLSKKYIGEFYAFLASCFFMSQSTFLQTELHARTNTAILFFALAMMVLFSDRIYPLKKRVLFIVFMASCMVSHYSTTYIFFFVMAGTFIGMEILSKKYTFKKVISLTITILFFSMVFFWYSQVTEVAFNSGVSFVENTLIRLNEFFVMEARSGSAGAMLGESIWQKGIPHQIEFIFTWLTFAFIGVGVITLVRRYKEMSFPELPFKKPDFLKDKFEVTYFVIALVLSGLLAATVSIPYITVGYSLERQYTLAIVVLSLFFVIGGITLSKHFFFLQKKTCAKRKSINQTASHNSFRKSRNEKNGLQVRAYLIILLVLVPYFFCVTGVMYNIFGVPRAISLNSEGEQYDMYYIHDQDSYAGKWFGKNYDKQQRIYVGDGTGSRVLVSQALIRKRAITIDSLSEHAKINGYIYLRYYNVVDGLALGGHNTTEMTEYSDMFVEKNKVYDNGGSEVWR